MFSSPLSRRVSVVIPTRNRPVMAHKAVLSVLAQTHPVHEVLVIIDGPEDDGPEDRSENNFENIPKHAPVSCATHTLLRSIHDERLRILSLPLSVGGGEARNTGVRASSGDWIAFLDDDDLWLPEKLRLQFSDLDAMSSEDTGELPVLSCPVLARSPSWQEIWPRTPYRAGQSMAEYLFCRKGWRYGAALLQTSTLLAPRALLLRIPFMPGLRKHQDWDWLLRVSHDPAVKVHAGPSVPLVVFHVEGERASVGRVKNWRFSLAWAQARSEYFPRKAIAGFLATECAPQAQQHPWRERMALLEALRKTGAMTVSDALRMVLFLAVPQRIRRRVRDLFSCLSTFAKRRMHVPKRTRAAPAA